MNRNRRKSSSSDNGSDHLSNRNTIKNNPASDSEEENTTSDHTNNANYIFDNLFAKAKQAEQKSMKQAVVDRPVLEEKPKAPKPSKTKEVKDLFSDNIFDDIDDIFTSNVKIPTKEANQNVKSIFDDDDDLFSDIAKTPKEIGKPKDTNSKPNSSKKSIFDSDDDLFGDLKDIKTSKNDKNKPEKTSSEIKTESQITRSRKETNKNTAKPDIVKDTTLPLDITKNVESNESKVKPKAKSKSIFDSDSDEDLFSDKIKVNKQNQVLKTSESETELFKDKKETQHVTLKAEPAKIIQSPSLFEEEEIDDLFINANKAKDAKESENTIIEQSITKDIPGIVNKHEDTEDIKFVIEDNSARVNENKTLPIVDTKPCDFSTNVTSKPDKLKDNIFTNVITENIDSNIAVNIANADIIEASQESLNNQSKNSFIDVAAESYLQEPVGQIDVNVETKNVDSQNDYLLPESQKPSTDKNKKEYSLDAEVSDSIFDEVPAKVKQDLIPEQDSLVPLAAAFEDIFKEPPAFEKTKETKKTVNVNALFEDDSDDEALFFKKNDVISDEKPDVFSPSANFGLFNDEPPAFLDFAPKATRNNQFEGDDDDLFSSIPKNAETTRNDEPPDIDEWNDDLENQSIKQSVKSTQKQDLNEGNNLFSSAEIPKLDTAVKTTIKERKEVPDSDEELFSNIPKPKVPETSQKEQTTKSENESLDQLDEVKPKDIKTETDKKIGKLNTKDFNINVQALVPGASPKKVPKEPSNDTTDNKKIATIQTGANKTEKEVSKTEAENTYSKAVKSSSFESKPESGVLDNKLSKQRPRIQVKRRPSSRRARHEAVRKSVIDIDDDTDNSSSFDEPLPKMMNQVTTPKENESYESRNQVACKTSIIDTTSNENKQDIVEIPSDKNTDIQKDFDEIDRMFKTDDQNKKYTLNIRNETTSDKSSLDQVDSKVISKIDANKSKITVTQNEESTSTTKVVYILNDEDIFTNKTDKHNDTKTSKTVQVNKDKQESLKTVQPKKENKSMFDLSDDDEDLFGKSSKPMKVEVKSKLFESDSEEDIFSTKKNKEVMKHKGVKENVKEGKAKGSLFGDDNDDDLFGVKTKTSIRKFF